MPRKRKAALAISDAELDPFAQQVEQALEHFANATWLGAHSPLAAPYFLGQSLTITTHSDNARARGQALQKVLLDAASQLEQELQELLRLVYFKKQHLDNVGFAMALHLSERTFYRNRIKAILALAHTLNHAVLPPLRPETPIERTMIGRTFALNHALGALRVGHSIYISGSSGIGKTTLGTAIVRQWLSTASDSNHAAQSVDAKRAFWYTLRNDFNDHITSLLFALGYFLRSLGAGYTWRQLVADRNVTDLDRTLGLLRYDLNSLQPALPLLCIDEADSLQHEASDHVQILHLLEELRTLCPLLLIGQRLLVSTDEQIHLTGMDQDELENLLTYKDAPPLTHELRQQLLTYTQGNPALILLFVSLMRNGDDAHEALKALAKAPSVEALFNRIWRRSGEAERHLLWQLAVFRNSAPKDAWQEQSRVLAHLHQRELVQFDGHGGLQLSAHLQRLTYERIPAELKPLLHLRAADIREARAEYVAAMYHVIEGRQLARAVWLWYVHRDNEIAQGRGAIALGLLRRISPADLPEERDRTALRVARAELFNLAGRPEEAEQELQASTTPAKSVLRAYVRRYEGYALEMQGRTEQALQKYRESLDTLNGLPQFNEVMAHNRLSFLHLYQLHNVKEARKEALLARAKADAFLGDLEAMAGNYTAALDYLLSAKNNTEAQGKDVTTLSRIYSYLGVLYLKLGEFDTSIDYINQAIDCDRKRGDEVGPLYDILNRAAAYILAGRYEQGYQDAQAGLQVAERLKNSYLSAGLAAGVAEACYGLGQWQEAERYSFYSLSFEEEFFRASALIVLGLVRQKQGNYPEAIKCLYAALDNTKQIEDRYTEAYVWRSLAHVHRDEGLWDAARSAFATALQLYTVLNLTKEVNELEEQLRELR